MTKYRARFIDKVRKDCGLDIPANAYIRMTYAKKRARELGAWYEYFSPPIYCGGVLHDIGWNVPYAVLLKCPRLKKTTNRFNQITISCGCSGERCGG